MYLHVWSSRCHGDPYIENIIMTSVILQSNTEKPERIMVLLFYPLYGVYEKSLKSLKVGFKKNNIKKKWFVVKQTEVHNITTA